MPRPKDNGSAKIQQASVDALELDNAAISQDPKNADLPPEGGYGWVCVACVALVNGHTWGINSVCNLEIPCGF